MHNMTQRQHAAARFPCLMAFKCLFLVAYSIVVAVSHAADQGGTRLALWNAALGYVVVGWLVVLIELCFFKDLKEISAALTFAVCVIALALYATNIWLMLRGDVDKCQPALIVFAWIQFFLSTLMLDAWLPAAAGDK